MKKHLFGRSSRRRGISPRLERIALLHVNSVTQASEAAMQLEWTWKRWRATRGLPDGDDPVGAYVGYSQEDPIGQARVVIDVDVADALLFAEMISYLIASRPLDRPLDRPLVRPVSHPGASSGPRPSGHAVANARPSAGHRSDHHERDGRVSSRLSSWDLGVPAPDTAEAERPIMRSSAPAATLAFSQRPV